MPEVSLTTFDLGDKSPEQLEQRRRELIALYGPNGLNKIEEMSLDHLRELAALTAALRRRTLPTAKARKPGAKKATKASADDLLSQL